MRKASELFVLNRKRDTFRIKAYKDAKVNLIILNDPSIITLLNIVYVPSYLTNIIVIERLSRENIY